MDAGVPDIARRMRDRVQRQKAVDFVFADPSHPDYQQSLREARESTRKIGQLPPCPPTVRGRLGARAVALTRRTLFWLLPQVQSALYEVLSAVEALTGRLTHNEKQAAATTAALERLAEEVEETARQAVLSADERVQAVPGLVSRMAELERQLALVRQEQAAVPEPPVFQDALAEIRRDLGEARQREARLRREIIEQSRRISLLLKEARKPEPSISAVAREEYLHRLDALYMSFEDVFRGTRADIKQRLEAYLPYVPPVDGPVLDVGCGRGEWLELLGERRIEARGVDWNTGMATACRELGLDVTQGDLVSFLRTLRSDSARMVTAFHVVEHIPFDAVIELLDEVVRVLKPGGVALFETPNPGNILVGSYSFYFDPTHRNPIPSPTLQFLVEARGLCNVEVVPPEAVPDVYFDWRPDQIPAEKFNSYFCGPWDYAVIGRKV